MIKSHVKCLIALLLIPAGCGGDAPTPDPGPKSTASRHDAEAPTAPAATPPPSAGTAKAPTKAPDAETPTGPTLRGLTAEDVRQALTERGFTVVAPERTADGVYLRRCEHVGAERRVVVEVTGRGPSDVFRVEATWQHFNAKGLDLGAIDLAVFLSGLPQSGDERERAKEWARSAFFKNESCKIGRVAYTTFEKRRGGTVLKMEAFR